MPKVISCLISQIFNSVRGCSCLLTQSMWLLSALSNIPSFSPSLHISFPLSAQLRSFEYHELSWQWIGRLSSQTRPKSQRSNTSDWSILTLVIHNVQSYVAFLEFWCIYSVILVANTHLKSESIAKKSVLSTLNLWSNPENVTGILPFLWVNGFNHLRFPDLDLSRLIDISERIQSLLFLPLSAPSFMTWAVPMASSCLCCCCCRDSWEFVHSGSLCEEINDPAASSIWNKG